MQPNYDAQDIMCQYRTIPNAEECTPYPDVHR
ncbi:conserved hypothetical protein, partial [Trichinella spiralis]